MFNWINDLFHRRTTVHSYRSVHIDAGKTVTVNGRPATPDEEKAVEEFFGKVDKEWKTVDDFFDNVGSAMHDLSRKTRG